MASFPSTAVVTIIAVMLLHLATLVTAVPIDLACGGPIVINSNGDYQALGCSNLGNITISGGGGLKVKVFIEGCNMMSGGFTISGASLSDSQITLSKCGVELVNFASFFTVANSALTNVDFLIDKTQIHMSSTGTTDSIVFAVAFSIINGGSVRINASTINATSIGSRAATQYCDRSNFFSGFAFGVFSTSLTLNGGTFASVLDSSGCAQYSSTAEIADVNGTIVASNNAALMQRVSNSLVGGASRITITRVRASIVSNSGTAGVIIHSQSPMGGASTIEVTDTALDLYSSLGQARVLRCLTDSAISGLSAVTIRNVTASVRASSGDAAIVELLQSALLDASIQIRASSFVTQAALSWTAGIHVRAATPLLRNASIMWIDTVLKVNGSVAYGFAFRDGNVADASRLLLFNVTVELIQCGDCRVFDFLNAVNITAGSLVEVRDSRLIATSSSGAILMITFAASCGVYNGSKFAIADSVITAYSPFPVIGLLMQNSGGIALNSVITFERVTMTLTSTATYALGVQILSSEIRSNGTLRLEGVTWDIAAPYVGGIDISASKPISYGSAVEILSSTIRATSDADAGSATALQLASNSNLVEGSSMVIINSHLISINLQNIAECVRIGNVLIDSASYVSIVNTSVTSNASTATGFSINSLTLAGSITWQNTTVVSEGSPVSDARGILLDGVSIMGGVLDIIASSIVAQGSYSAYSIRMTGPSVVRHATLRITRSAVACTAYSDCAALSTTNVQMSDFAFAIIDANISATATTGDGYAISFGATTALQGNTAVTVLRSWLTVTAGASGAGLLYNGNGDLVRTLSLNVNESSVNVIAASSAQGIRFLVMTLNDCQLGFTKSSMAVYSGDKGSGFNAEAVSFRNHSALVMTASSIAVISSEDDATSILLDGSQLDASAVRVVNVSVRAQASKMATAALLNQTPMLSSSVVFVDVDANINGSADAAAFWVHEDSEFTSSSFAVFNSTLRVTSEAVATGILVDEGSNIGTNSSLLVDRCIATIRSPMSTVRFIGMPSATILGANASVTVSNSHLALYAAQTASFLHAVTLDGGGTVEVTQSNVQFIANGSASVFQGTLTANARMKLDHSLFDCVSRCGNWATLTADAANTTMITIRDVDLRSFDVQVATVARAPCELKCSTLNRTRLTIVGGAAGLCEPSLSRESRRLECVTATPSLSFTSPTIVFTTSPVPPTASSTTTTTRTKSTTASASRSASKSPSRTHSHPTSSLSVSVSRSRTRSGSATRSVSPSVTPTWSLSSSKSLSPSESVTKTVTLSARSTSITVTSSATFTKSTTRTRTSSPTPSMELLATQTQTPIVTPPPAQPVPVTVSEAIDGTAAAVTTAISVLVNPAHASQASRASLVRRIAECKQDDVLPPESAESPTGLEIGSTARNTDQQRSVGKHAGGVLGNSVIVLASMCAVLLLAACKLVVMMRRTGRGAEWRRAAAWARFPAAFSVPLAFFSGPLALSGTISAVLAPPGTAVVTTAVVLLVLAMPSAALVYFFLRRFRNMFVSKENPLGNTEGSHATKQLWMAHLQRVMTPQVEWHEVGVGTQQLRQLGMFFAAYKDNAPWFFLVEVLWVNVAASMAAALSVKITCVAAAWITFAIYAVFVGLLLWFRPYTVKLEMVGQAVVATLQTLVAALQALGLLIAAINGTSEWEDGKAAADAASVCVTIASALIMLVSLADLYAFVRMHYRLWKERRGSGLAEAQVALLSDVPAIARPLMAPSEETVTEVSAMSATMTPQPEPAGVSAEQAMLDEQALQQQQEQQEAQRREKAAYWEELHRNADELLQRRKDEQSHGDTLSDESAARPLWQPSFQRSNPGEATSYNPLHDQTPQLTATAALDDVLRRLACIGPPGAAQERLGRAAG
jgi:hypothetical protein